MESAKSPLDQVRIAAPCSQRWEDMAGDDRSRFCAACGLNVFNLSGMGRAEAESLLIARRGRLCVRYYRRADGTILTEDCPVGLAAVRRRLAKLATLVSVALAAVAAGIGLRKARLARPSPSWPLGGHTMGKVARGAVTMGEPVMGDVAAPPR